MCIRVSKRDDPQNYKVLKFYLYPRYWNKVTTFRLPDTIERLPQKSNAHIIPLNTESFEYGFLKNYFMSQIQLCRDAISSYSSQMGEKSRDFKPTIVEISKICNPQLIANFGLHLRH